MYPKNVTDFPPIPTYTLTPIPPLLPFISDKHLLLVLPVVVYWAYGLLFHMFNEKRLFQQYRLHTPAEFEMRNKVTTTQVVWNIATQQAFNLGVGMWLMSPEPDMRGSEEYDVAVWATRIRTASRMVPKLLAVVGIDAKTWASNLSQYTLLAGSFAGKEAHVSQFASWELLGGSLMYWYIFPALQFGLAIFIADAWQYFWHRILHQNKFLYSENSLTGFPNEK